MVASTLFASGEPWWLVHTKSRHEKALASDLGRRGIGCYLPCVQVDRQRLGRTSSSRIPLFPGYLFLRGGDEDRYAALSTNRAASVIPVADQAGLHDSLLHIHRVLEAGHPVDVFPAIKDGCRCRVRAGALKGLEGVVLRRRAICRVYVAVDVLGQSAELEIDAEYLEVIGE